MEKFYCDACNYLFMAKNLNKKSSSVNNDDSVKSI